MLVCLFVSLSVVLRAIFVCFIFLLRFILRVGKPLSSFEIVSIQQVNCPVLSTSFSHSLYLDFLKNFRLGAIKTKVVAPKCAHVYLASTYEAQKIEVSFD